MKTLILLTLLLSGCAHSRVDSWRGDEITACGNRWAHRSDLEAKAEESCGSPVTTIGGFQQSSGAVFTSYGMRMIRENCLVFKCSSREPAAK